MKTRARTSCEPFLAFQNSVAKVGMGMGDHYFSEQPRTKSEPRTWETALRGTALCLTSDAGVFAKQGLDEGSRLLTEHFRYPAVEGKLLDLGCGYGPIGLALAAAAPRRCVLMVDINVRAVQLAEQNARINNIAQAAIFQSDLFSEVKDDDFAAIVSNPPIRAGKALLYRMFTEARDHLCAGGELWLVIRKQQGAASAVKKLAEIFSDVVVEKKKKGYVIIRALNK